MRTDAYDATSWAILVLAHESWHLRGEADEGLANCFGMQSGVEAAQRLGQITEFAPVNIAFADDDLVVRYLNPAAKKTLGKLARLLPVQPEEARVIYDTYVALYRDSANVAFTPMKDGKALDEAEFAQLPEAERELIFSRFWRRDRAKGDSRGLGLAIVSRVAEAHEGSISVDNRPEGGAVFTLRLRPA